MSSFLSLSWALNQNSYITWTNQNRNTSTKYYTQAHTCVLKFIKQWSCRTNIVSSVAHRMFPTHCVITAKPWESIIGYNRQLISIHGVSSTPAHRVLTSKFTHQIISMGKINLWHIRPDIIFEFNGVFTGADSQVSAWLCHRIEIKNDENLKF